MSIFKRVKNLWQGTYDEYRGKDSKHGVGMGQTAHKLASDPTMQGVGTGIAAGVLIGGTGGLGAAALGGLAYGGIGGALAGRQQKAQTAEEIEEQRILNADITKESELRERNADNRSKSSSTLLTQQQPKKTILG